MARTLTLFNRSALSRGALVYSSDYKNRSEALASSTPLYEIDCKLKYIELRRTTATGSESLLKGKYGGLLHRSVELEGFGSMTTAKRTGIVKQGWSFVDFTSNEFTWHVSCWSATWTLLDINGAVVAKLNRASFSPTKIGTLEIMEDMPESMRAL
ncbi:hypothetical protein GGI04_002867, partial [Coemansia thaxteri]